MAITDTDLDYFESLHGKLAGAFASMDDEGGRESMPIVATGVGRALHVLVRATAARSVVEVGTAIGYSAVWMATALPADGRIDMIDLTPRAPIAHGSSGTRLVWARRSSCTGESAIAACPFGSMRT